MRSPEASCSGGERGRALDLASLGLVLQRTVVDVLVAAAALGCLVALDGEEADDKGRILKGVLAASVLVESPPSMFGNEDCLPDFLTTDPGSCDVVA